MQTETHISGDGGATRHVSVSPVSPVHPRSEAWSDREVHRSLPQKIILNCMGIPGREFNPRALLTPLILNRSLNSTTNCLQLALDLRPDAFGRSGSALGVGHPPPPDVHPEYQRMERPLHTCAVCRAASASLQRTPILRSFHCMTLLRSSAPPNSNGNSTSRRVRPPAWYRSSMVADANTLRKQGGRASAFTRADLALLVSVIRSDNHRLSHQALSSL